MRTTLAAIAVGGALGALARFGLTRAFPAAPGGFPWATWSINVGGCLLIGVLMAWLAAVTAPAWVRPLLGIGVLGGFTTFSAHTGDAIMLVHTGHPVVAAVYVAATLVGALLAVFAGSQLTRKVLRT